MTVMSPFLLGELLLHGGTRVRTWANQQTEVSKKGEGAVIGRWQVGSATTHTIFHNVLDEDGASEAKYIKKKGTGTKKK